MYIYIYVYIYMYSGKTTWDRLFQRLISFPFVRTIDLSSSSKLLSHRQFCETNGRMGEVMRELTLKAKGSGKKIPSRIPMVSLLCLPCHGTVGMLVSEVEAGGRVVWLLVAKARFLGFKGDNDVKRAPWSCRMAPQFLV